MADDGNDTISQIVTQLAVIQAALTPPSDAAKEPIVYDEMPIEPTVFPCFINVPRTGRETRAEAGLRSSVEQIDMILLLSKAEDKYSVRAQRLWVPVVRDAFSAALKLDNNAVQYARITEWNYDPIEINSVPYIGVTFTLECHISETFTFGP